MTTATNITRAQITNLRNEAASAGDSKMVAIATRALAGSRRATAECARCIRSAEAMA